MLSGNVARLNARTTPKEPDLPNALKKTIYTLRVNDYAPEICSLTMPLMQAYADKIGADLVVLTERKRPDWPITIEKFQVAEQAKLRGDDWSIFIDADTLINPEFFDPTELMKKDTVAHNGKDMNLVRWKPDNYFRRDGRWWGSCTWLVIASDWTVEDLWQFPTESPEKTFDQISITVEEHNSGQCHREHLIDDYTLSRNIARYGLKATTVLELLGQQGWKTPEGRNFNPYLWHIYTRTWEEKLKRMITVLSTPNQAIIPHPGNPQMAMDVGWGLMDPAQANQLREKWNLR